MRAMTTLLTVPVTDAEVAAAGAAGLAFGLIAGLVFYVIGSLGLMGIFKKAGQPGWAAFVPVYNYIVLLKIVGRPVWWIVLVLFVPIVNVVVLIVVMNDLAKSFGKTTGFTVGLVLLQVVFTWILWLGSATYRGPAAAPSTAYAA